MKDENKKCRTCGSFKGYYTKGYCSLLRENNGFCYKFGRVMEKSDSCEHWRCRHTSKKDSVNIAIRAIPEIYNKIAVIEQILLEETDMQKNKNDT